MKPIKLLLAVLPNISWNDPQMEGQKRFHRLLLYLLEGASSLFLLFALLQIVVGKWITAIPLALAGIWILALLLFLVKRFPLMQRLGPEALRLRAAAEGEDDQIAPLAGEQPAPLSTEEQPAEDLRLSPLWVYKDTHTSSTIFGIVLICLPLVVGAIAWIILGQQALSYNPMMFIVFFIVIIACIPFVFGGIQSLQWARKTVQEAYVLANEQGVHWQRPLSTKTSAPYSIDWKQTRSFFMIAAAEPGTDTWLRGYALDAHALLFTWQISQRSSAQERAASDMLCRVIVTHTQLPLRDLSAAAEQISRQIESGQQAEHNESNSARRAEDE
jgi:hypothetical protein